MSISTHILDTSRGLPAAGVSISLAQLDKTNWIVINETRSDDDGRVKSLLPEGWSAKTQPATYRLRFETAPYFVAHGELSLYPYVDIIFEVDGAAHYHIPLLLTRNGYTTYRGS